MNKVIKVELATTPEKLARGLMYRDSLPDHEGMLFVFDRAQQLSFWGRNTFIPLDIAFITREGKVESIGKIKKLSEYPTRSKNACLYALEVPEGYLSKNDIAVGDHMLLDHDKDQWLVKFEKGDRPHVKQAQKTPKNHPMLPFDQVFPNDPMPEWMQDAQDMVGQQQKPQPGDNMGHGFEGDSDQPDPATLPEIDIGDIQIADDEEDGDEPWAGGEQEDPAAMSPDAFDQKQQDDAQEQAPPPPEEGLPDPRRMGTQDALKYAMDKGLVVWINYRCKNAKRKVGMKPPRVIHRMIQPHGFYHAKTTGNFLVVTWDISVNDFRAYIVPNITAKGFTGQTFKKFFRVAGDDSSKIKTDGAQNPNPAQPQQGNGPLGL